MQNYDIVLNENNDFLYLQSINIEGEVTNSQSTEERLSRNLCQYDMLELAEQLDDVDNSVLLKDKSRWNVTTKVCGNYPNSSMLK